MSAVIAAAVARPESESYGTPRDMRKAPRFAKPSPSGRNSCEFFVIAGVG